MLGGKFVNNELSGQGWLRAIWEKLDSPQYQSQIGSLIADRKISEFEGRFNINLNEQDWVLPTNIGGSITHLPVTGGCELSCGTASGNNITRQTYSRYYYLPNKVISSSAGFQFTPQPGMIVELGIFDDKDGYFLRFVGNQTFFVRRYTYEDNITQEEVVSQSSWNGANVVTDLSLIHMCSIEHTWYGGGCANLFFRFDNDNILHHTFRGGERLNNPIIGNPNLPIRFTVRNISEVAVPSTLRHWGVSVDYTGGREPIGLPQALPSVSKAVSTSPTPIVAVRNKTTINGIPNYKSHVTNLLFRYYAVDRDCNIQLVFNPDTLDGAWVGNADVLEYNSTCTTFTGGRVVQGDSVPAGFAGQLDLYASNRLFGPASDLSSTDVLLFVATARSGGSNSFVSTTVNYQEII